jgi:hypothetical protein
VIQQQCLLQHQQQQQRRKPSIELSAGLVEAKLS